MPSYAIEVMSEIIAQAKIDQVPKGCRILVVPMNQHAGDRATTIGYPCTEEPESPFEIRAPFEAVFEDFDGERIKVRTPRFYCLAIHVEEIKEIRKLKPDSTGCL